MATADTAQTPLGFGAPGTAADVLAGLDLTGRLACPPREAGRSGVRP
jgi:hypothetical protein